MLNPIDPNIPTPSTVTKKETPVTSKVSPPTASSKEIETFAKSAATWVRLSEDQRISLQKVQKVDFTEDLEKQLKPGDIILCYQPVTVSAVDFAIRSGQQLAKKFFGYDMADVSHSFTHVALYIGNGHVSEAAPNGVVINKFQGERFKLKPGMTDSHLIVRLNDEKLAQEACEIAAKVASQKEGETPLAYSVMKALDASVSQGQLDLEGVKRYLQGAYYAHTGEIPTNKKGRREFFCSYLIGWACQGAESKDLIKSINERLVKAGKEPIEFPDLTDIPEMQRADILSRWSKATARKYLPVFKTEIKLKFDPKLMTPQHFYDFVLNHPELFTQIMRIVPPEK